MENIRSKDGNEGGSEALGRPINSFSCYNWPEKEGKPHLWNEGTTEGLGFSFPIILQERKASQRRSELLCA